MLPLCSALRTRPPLQQLSSQPSVNHLAPLRQQAACTCACNSNTDKWHDLKELEEIHTRLLWRRASLTGTSGTGSATEAADWETYEL